MFGNLGLPELLGIGLVALIAAIWPLAFFLLGYYLGRRSMRNAGASPAGSATPALSVAEGSTPPHV